MFIPPMEPREVIERRLRANRLEDRRNFRREVVLRVLPTLMRSEMAIGSAVSVAFDVAHECIALDEREAAEDGK